MRTVLNTTFSIAKNEDHLSGLGGGGLGREQSSLLKGILLGEYHPPKCSRKLDNNAMKFEVERPLEIEELFRDVVHFS